MLSNRVLSHPFLNLSIPSLHFFSLLVPSHPIPSQLIPSHPIPSHPIPSHPITPHHPIACSLDSSMSDDLKNKMRDYSCDVEAHPVVGGSD